MRRALTLPRPLSVRGVASLRDAEAPAIAELDGRQRKQMSRAAGLAQTVLRDVLVDAGFHEGRDRIGAFFGVGGSGPALAELAALLAGSVDAGNFSMRRFGERGLYAANPLLAFQLMNNFTLCHGAIDSRLGGPNGALFSRGAGTVFALQAAAWSILDGDCDRALAGGADSALHPVTRCELARQGAIAAGLVPGEGAAALALADAEAEESDRGIELFACAVFAGDSSAPEALIRVIDAAPLVDVVAASLDSEAARDIDTVVTSGAVQALRTLFAESIDARWPSAPPQHIETAAASETLAAAPALAWSVAVRRLRSGSARRVLVLSAGLDGDLGLVGLQRRA